MSKIMSNIVSKNQAVFVPGRRIHDHILLTYELIRGYYRKGGVPRFMIQMDVQKTYDSDDWQALHVIL